jgi:glycosyltransferase involved in cell wall biosynthesis
MTRVLVVHNRYRSRFASGENRVVEQEIELLRQAGHTVVSYVRDSDEIARFTLADSIRLPARVTWSGEDRRAVARLAVRTQPEVVHFHNTFPLISPSAIHAVAALGIPSVVTLHNFRVFCANGLLFRGGQPCEACVGTSPLPGVLHGCYRGSKHATAPIAVNIAVHRRLKTWERVSAFLALSGFARDRMIAGGLPADRILIKANSVPPPSKVRENAGTRFLFLGRLSQEKGADLLVSAWSKDLGTLLIAGDGPMLETLRAQALAYGTSIRLLGHRSASDCSELLRSARALVVPSRAYEGFPLAVIEAYAHGVPVIAPAHGSFPEIVQHGSTGLLFRPGDPSDLARQMGELHSPRRSEEMGAAARRAYDARYTPERNLMALNSIYERLSVGGSAGPGPPPSRPIGGRAIASRAEGDA